MHSGVWYPAGPDGLGQYGLSRHYGFGPDVEELPTESIAEFVKAAKSSNCRRMILSSEYLSLHRPHAASRMIRDLELCGCDATFLILSRDLCSWVRSLFNQYVRTVEDGPYMRTIDDYVDQVLTNRAIDFGARYKMWAELVGDDRMVHYRLSSNTSDTIVLRPFSDFAGMPLSAPENAVRNGSIQANALFRIGQLRSRIRNSDEEAELSRLLSGEICMAPAPDDYIHISPGRRARLQIEVGYAYDALPYLELEQHGDNLTKTASAAA